MDYLFWSCFVISICFLLLVVFYLAFCVGQCSLFSNQVGRIFVRGAESIGGV